MCLILITLIEILIAFVPQSITVQNIAEMSCKFWLFLKKKLLKQVVFPALCR